jgi:methylated-DNA-[protein]-cysteine S-methyltransferase
MIDTRKRPARAVLGGRCELGALAVECRDGFVIGVRFGHASQSAAIAALGASLDRQGSSEAGDEDFELAAEVLERLVRYAAGEPVDFRDVPVDDGHLSAFQRRVVRGCRTIPIGGRRTYGELASAAGSPGAARAVGQVMASNRVPLIVPCHRVVASGGGLGGFSAPQGLAMKRRLLALEEEMAGAPRRPR